MKTQKLTFNNFRGLDRRVVQMWTSAVAKPTQVGFEEMYGYIKEGILHPLPAYATVQSWTGRLFEVGGDLFFMSSTGVAKRNGTSFVSFITQAFSTTSPDYRDMKPFFELKSAGWVSLTYVSSTEWSITVSETMPINKYVNKHVIIGTLPTPWDQTLYITGNDAHTLYTDGLINGDIVVWSPAVSVFDHDPIFIVYDGATVYRFTTAWTSLGISSTFANGFIEVFSNRLYLLKTNQITFSTFNSSIFLNNPYNYIDTEWTIVDKVIKGNVLVVFTTNGTYWLSGTGYTTMNFPKISEFAPKSRVWPCTQIDTTYLIWNWYVRVFDTSNWLQPIQYNYVIIPDTQGKIYAIERWIIFPLGHGTNKSGIITVEWAKTMLSSTTINITNFYDQTITDLLEYKWVIFIISWWVIYQQSWVSNPSFKLNDFRLPYKVFWDNMDLAQGGNYPASITALLDWVSKTCNRNDWANQVSYPIRDTAYSIQVSVTTTDPIFAFNIYYQK